MRGVLPAELHDPLDTVILAPKMPQGRPAPFRIPITHDGQKGLVPLDQLRSVDRERLATKWGVVPAKTLLETLVTRQEVFSQ